MRLFEFSIQEKSIVFSASTPKKFSPNMVDVDFSFTFYLKYPFLRRTTRFATNLESLYILNSTINLQQGVNLRVSCIAGLLVTTTMV